MNELRFATPGIPTNVKGTAEGIKEVKKIGLGAMEVEFTRAIHMTKEKAPEIGEIAKKNDVVLTCHAPFYINLNSAERKKYYASIGYVKNSAQVMSLAKGYSVVFHAGYYMKQEPEKVYKKIKEGVKSIVKEVKEFDDKIWIRPETTGKATQFGDIDELLRLSKEVEQVMPCIDFSHLYARSIGMNNTKKEFDEILKKTEKALGKEGLKKMHIHISGIEYGDKGEKNHVDLKDTKFNYKDVLRSLKEFKCKGVVVSESPNIQKDAVKLYETYKKI